MTDQLLFLVAVLAIVAALIGLVPIECNDSNCKSVHKQHREREADAKALSLHRGNHKNFYDPTCRHCRERADAGYK
jgi:hypothetical protein